VGAQSALPTVARQVVNEWIKIEFQKIVERVNHKRKKFRWDWVKIERSGQPARVALVDPQGQLWLLKMNKGTWIKPYGETSDMAGNQRADRQLNDKAVAGNNGSAG